MERLIRDHIAVAGPRRISRIRRIDTLLADIGFSSQDARRAAALASG
jgi:hypothetical protein